MWLRKRITSHMFWEFPDLGVITAGVFITWLGLCSIWPVFTLYMRGKGVSLIDISITSASFMAANFLFQVPMGWASDRIGRKPLLLGGLIVHGAVSLLYLQTQDTMGFMVLRFIEGVGASAMMPAARAHVMDTIPPARRGQAFGLLGAAFNGGIMLGPAIGGLMAGTTGISGPFWFGAITSAIAFVFLALKVHDQRHAQVEADRVAAESTGVRQDRVVWRAILPLFMTTIGWGFVGGFFTVVWNIWIHDLGGSLDVIGLSYTLFGLPLIFVGPWAGRFADRHNRVLLILIPSLVAGAIYFAYGFLTSIPIILALGVLEGAMIGILDPASSSYTADVLPAGVRGRMQGMISSTNTGIGFVSTLICGPLYAAGPIYLFVVLACVHIVSAIIASVLMWPTERTLQARRALAAQKALAGEPEPALVTANAA